MSRLGWSIAGLVVCSLPPACGAPCLDDGFGQSVCPTQTSASDTTGTTSSSTTGDSSTTAPSTASMGSMTEVMSGSQTGVQTSTTGTADDTSTTAATDGTTDTASATEGETETSGGTLWCADVDGDGFGDPDECQQSDVPVGGSVPNGDDCDDNDANTFPGAAPNDDPIACMRDADDDDWGDQAPPPGVDAGTDCDDTNASAFPGAAPNETPPDLCTIDSDGDGWGDADPGGGGGGGGPQPGSDCFETNPDLNPDTLELTAFSPFLANMFAQRTIDTVDLGDGSLSTFVVLETPMGTTPNINIATVGLDETGEIYGNDVNSVRLYSIDYAGQCMMGQGEVTPLGMSYAGPSEVVCGLEFGSDGTLYGIDYFDNLLVFDPVSGQVSATIPLELGGVPLNIHSCGMALDCTEDRLLVANGQDHTIYSVDTATGATTVVRDLSAFFAPPWSPTGLAYDPVTRNAYLSIGSSLWTVDLDSMDAPIEIGPFGQQVSNLQYLPICM